MADYQYNPFYANPYIDRAADSLVKAFTPDSRDAVNAASAAKINEETSQLKTRGAGQTRYNTLVSGDLSSPQSIAALFEAGAQAGLSTDQVSRAVLARLANGGAADPVVARAWIGAGHGMNKDSAFSIPDREAVAKRENDEAARRTGISAGATIEAARIHERGATEREDRKDDRTTVNVLVADPSNPGGPPVPRMMTKKDALKLGYDAQPVLPSNYYEKGVGQNGRPAFGLPGQGQITPTPERVPMIDAFDPKSGVTTRQPDMPGTVRPPVPVHNTPMIDAFDPKTGVTTRQEDKPGVVRPPPHASNPPQPPHLPPAEMNQIEINALRGIKDATKANGNYTDIDETFATEYGPQLAAARAAASKVFQATRNSEAATQAYLQALGVPVGTRWQSGGMFSNKGLFDASGKLVTLAPQAPVSIMQNFTPPPAAAPAAVPQAAPAPAPAASPAQQGGADPLAQAREAIAKGADRNAVIQRLRQNGIDPKGL